MAPGDFAPAGAGRHARAPVLLKLRVGLETQASLIVAAFDLKVVQLLRDAIRNADAASGRRGPLGTVVDNPRPQIHPTPRFLPRPVIEPTPQFEPRRTIHLHDRFEPQPHPAPAEPERPVTTRSPIKPPWRIPPGEIPPEPRPIIKTIVQRPDIISKGSLIDFFI